MNSRKISRLFLRIFATLLCVVAFSSIVLIAASSWFTAKYETLWHQQNRRSIDAVNDQLAQNIQSVYELCDVILNNQIVTENLRPYTELTALQRYNYDAIIKLLRQGRLQMNGLIDSLFLYTDSQKVLYAQEDKGMADFDVFFGKFIHYEKYDREFWQEKLDVSGRVLQVLPSDTYQSDKVNDKRIVIPILYSVRERSSTYVLVINLSLQNILKQFEINEVYPKTQYAVFSENDEFIMGTTEETHFVDENNDIIRLAGGEYYCYVIPQKSIRAKIIFYVPKNAIGAQLSTYRTVAMVLIAVFSVAGVLLVLKASQRAYAPIKIVKEDIKNMPDEVRTLSDNNEVELIRNTLMRLINDRSAFQNRNRLHSEHYMTQSIVSLLEGKPVNDIAYFNMMLTKEYGFSGSNYFCAGVVIELDDAEDYVLRKELVDQIKDYIESMLSTSMAFLCFAYQSNMLILLGDGDDEARQHCRDVFEKAKTLYENSCNLRMGVGGCVSGPDEIIESYYQANTEIFLSDVGHNAVGEFVYDPNEVRNAAFSRDIVQIEEVVRNILDRAKQHRVPYKDAANLLDDISKTIIDTLRKINTEKASFLPQKESVNALKVLLLYPEINISPLTAVVLPYIGAPMVETESNTDKLANQVKKYVEEHYQEELSLDILADKMEISPKYLSRVFKQIIGINLSEYLMYIRIENAKKMLLTDMNINEIMERVGINNRTTFTRSFKRLEGITPNEYRTLHR